MATSEIKRGDPGIDPKTGEYRVVGVSETFKSVTEKISGIVLTPHTPLGWLAFFGVAGAGATVLLVAVTWLFLKGVGIWAITQPVAWGFAHHELRLVDRYRPRRDAHQRHPSSSSGRSGATAINRFAEAMTIFAVICALIFPRHPRRPPVARILPVPDPAP